MIHQNLNMVQDRSDWSKIDKWSLNCILVCSTTLLLMLVLVTVCDNIDTKIHKQDANLQCHTVFTTSTVICSCSRRGRDGAEFYWLFMWNVILWLHHLWLIFTVPLIFFYSIPEVQLSRQLDITTRQNQN